MRNSAPATRNAGRADGTSVARINVFMTRLSRRPQPFGKDYVSCLSMPGRHTLEAVELRHLRYFVAVAEMENVSRAAMQRLHVSQPSLSRQIRDLEDEMGVRLLERTAKSVKLTDAGRAFLDEARAILKQTNDAVGKVRAIAGKGETELHVGDWPLLTAGMMPQLLRAYQRAV